MGGPRPSRRRGFEAFSQAPPQDGASLHFTDEELEAGGGVCVTLQGHARSRGDFHHRQPGWG